MGTSLHRHATESFLFCLRRLNLINALKKLLMNSTQSPLWRKKWNLNIPVNLRQNIKNSKDVMKFMVKLTSLQLKTFSWFEVWPIRETAVYVRKTYQNRATTFI